MSASGSPFAWGTSFGPAVPTFDAGLVTYVNAVEIVGSQWEFTLLLSQISATPQSPSDSGTEPGVEPSVKLTKTLIGRFAMSPQHTKALLEVLRERVQSYEDHFGVIPLLLPAPEEEAGADAGATPERDLPEEPTDARPEDPSQGD